MQSIDLIQFYMGSHPDHKGRYLSDILAQDNAWLEATHDYIQWLFPNTTPSRITPNTPTLTPEVISEFKINNVLKNQLFYSFQRILNFYGLAYQNSKIDKAKNWIERKDNWFTKNTHNNLRITRIIKCLNSLGLSQQADDLYDALMELYQFETDCGISSKVMHIWTTTICEK